MTDHGKDGGEDKSCECAGKCGGARCTPCMLIWGAAILALIVSLFLR